MCIRDRDIVVNGMSQRAYEVRAFACDPESTKKRTEYANLLARDVEERELFSELQNNLGIDLRMDESKSLNLESPEELQLHLQLEFCLTSKNIFIAFQPSDLSEEI